MQDAIKLMYNPKGTGANTRWSQQHEWHMNRKCGKRNEKHNSTNTKYTDNKKKIKQITNSEWSCPLVENKSDFELNKRENMKWIR